MPDDVVLNKVAAIERCLGRVREEYEGYEDELEINLTRQDSIILNLQRACETAIDLAMHIVRMRRLGLPQESREAFALLQEAGLLDAGVARQMQKMVGFSNIAVHGYQKLDLEIVRSILTERLDDFRSFAAVMLQVQDTD